MTRLLLLALVMGLMTGVTAGKDNDKNKPDPDPVTVPEPSQVVPALALFAGSTLILRSRRKK